MRLLCFFLRLLKISCPSESKQSQSKQRIHQNVERREARRPSPLFGVSIEACKSHYACVELALKVENLLMRFYAQCCCRWKSVSEKISSFDMANRRFNTTFTRASIILWGALTHLRDMLVINGYSYDVISKHERDCE